MVDSNTTKFQIMRGSPSGVGVFILMVILQLIVPYLIIESNGEKNGEEGNPIERSLISQEKNMSRANLVFGASTSVGFVKT